MGCNQSLPENMEKNLIESCCKMILNGNPTLEEVKGLILQIPNRERTHWPDSDNGPLICAVRKNRKDLIQFMVEKANIDINSTYQCRDVPPHGWCALSAAIWDENQDLATFLVSNS